MLGVYLGEENTHQAGFEFPKCGGKQFTAQMSVTQSNRARDGNRKQQGRGRREEGGREKGSWAGVKVISLVGWR